MNKLIYFVVFFTLVGCVVFVFYPISNFPETKGLYSVGCVKCHWIDSSRKELNEQNSEHPNREIMVHVFYPSLPKGFDGTGPTEKNLQIRVPYDPDAAKSSIDFLASSNGLPKWLFRGIKSIKTYIQYGAPIDKNKSPFPVIIFSHGGGPMVQQYTYMLEELASQGFVVVGINHPYIAAIVRYPDGQIVKSIYPEKGKDPKWKEAQLETNAQDISFVINKLEELVVKKDEFWSNVDLNKIGVLGHSFGGRTATHVIRKDARIKCGVNLDGGAQDEDIADQFPKPFLFMLAQKSFLWNKESSKYLTQAKPFLNKIEKLASANGDTKIITINNIGHLGFSDTPLQLNMTLCMRLVSCWKIHILEASADKATKVLVNNVMPKIIDFFEDQFKKTKESNEQQTRTF